jgi:hypothetical protein
MNDTDFRPGTSFYPTIEALDEEVSSLLEAGDANASMERIQAFVRTVMFDRRAIAKVFADATLDSLCQRIGAMVVSSLAPTPPTQGVEQADCVILATELYRAGGHSAVIADLVRTGRFGKRPVLILTDTLNSADATIAAERYGDQVTAEIAPAGSLIDKLHWTLMRLNALRPRRLVLLNHHYDAVAIAAAQPGIADQTVFYHHGDHQLCLGVTLKHTLHVDPHSIGFHHCRHELGVTDNVFWPLIVDDLGTRPRLARHTALRTCSSGSSNKFELDYKYRYVDLVPQLLARTGGTHVHIGPLSEGALERIYDGIDKLSVPHERFVLIPWVQSVWRALQEHQIDVYLTSFPLGGGRAAIEAMGAGVPMIGHSCFVSSFFGGQDMLYPEAYLWETPDELLAHLDSIDGQQLERESRLARLHYEQHHTMSALMQAIDAGSAAPVPLPLRPQHRDPMQSFLDDVRYALQDHLTAAEIAPVFDQIKHDQAATSVRTIESEALSQNAREKTIALINVYSREVAQLREQLARAEQSVAALTTTVSQPRVRRFARIAQRAVSLFRG